MQKFYESYAVYKGITYIRTDYQDRIDLFSTSDSERKNVLFQVRSDELDDIYNVINHAILNGIDYVYYEIENEIVTYGSTACNENTQKRPQKDFDFIYQMIIRDKNKEQKIIYVNEKKSLNDFKDKKFYLEETASKSIMFCTDNNIVSQKDVHDALEKMYPGRLSNEKILDNGIGTDEILTSVEIDGIEIDIDEDLCYEFTTVYSMNKEFGEKYIREIVDYFNRLAKDEKHADIL